MAGKWRRRDFGRFVRRFLILSLSLSLSLSLPAAKSHGRCEINRAPYLNQMTERFRRLKACNGRNVLIAINGGEQVGWMRLYVGNESDKTKR